VSERERIQTPYLAPEDDFELTLRPRRLEEFVGQAQLKEQLSVSIEAATARGEALDHVLLAGPPGLGKTSLAQIVAVELGVPFVQTAGPALERKGDIASFLTSLEPRSVFFVDEIHRLPRARHEYPTAESMNWRGKAANEDAAMDIAEKAYRDRYSDAGKLHMHVVRRRRLYRP
jgi:Holliday junction DNA helicase RuvB